MKKGSLKRKLILGVSTIALTATLLTTTTFAWIARNAEAWMDDFDLELDSSLGLLMSLDGENFSQNITKDKILKQLVINSGAKTKEEADLMTNEELFENNKELKYEGVSLGSYASGNVSFDPVTNRPKFYKDSVECNFEIADVSNYYGQAIPNDIEYYTGDGLNFEKALKRPNPVFEVDGEGNLKKYATFSLVTGEDKLVKNPKEEGWFVENSSGWFVVTEDVVAMSTRRYYLKNDIQGGVEGEILPAGACEDGEQKYTEEGEQKIRVVYKPWNPVVFDNYRKYYLRKDGVTSDKAFSHVSIDAEDGDYVWFDIYFRISNTKKVKKPYELTFTDETSILDQGRKDIRLDNGMNNGTELNAGDHVTVSPKNAMRIAVTDPTLAATNPTDAVKGIFEIVDEYDLGSSAIEGAESGTKHDKLTNAMYTYYNTINDHVPFEYGATDGNAYATQSSFSNTVLGLFEADADGQYEDIKLTVSVYLEGWDADFFTGIPEEASIMNIYLSFVLKEHI